MELAIIICASICILMILSVLFFPKIKIKNIKLDTYWIITLIGALILIIFKIVDYKTVINSLTANTSINPIKILVLFISMTILSIYLDELGFFKYLASITLKKAKKGQTTLFFYLYLIVSILTVFTSNDIIILSFTPFICYFAKNAKIDPIPYLAAEFVAANTWSMCLIIGNPTNIYLATANGIDFIQYLKVMILPTICAGLFAFIFLYVMFRKKLKLPINGEPVEVKINDKTSLTIGLLHLGLCTIFLIISSYISLEMWLISLCSFISLIVVTLIVSLIRNKKPIELGRCIKRGPFELIPFILSMFVLIVCLSQYKVTNIIASFLGEKSPIIKYGISSFLSANIINNIPMSVLFSSIIESANISISQSAVYATIIGSNIGAFLTPIGALAGIMFSSILQDHNVKFGYLSFIKIGLIVAVPTILAALLVLSFVI